MTKGELYFGAYNSSRVEKNLERIQAFFKTPGPEVMSLDDAVMNCFGQLKAAGRLGGGTKPNILILQMILLNEAASAAEKPKSYMVYSFRCSSGNTLKNINFSKGVYHEPVRSKTL
jgi:hypothetical protein